jgi:tripartite ATP-independent transporter DctM subunit
MLLEWVPLLLFICVCLLLLYGYPVAFTLGGTALIFAGIGIVTGHFDPKWLSNMPGRLFGLIGNETLLAVPLFVFMGVVLEKTRIAEQLLANMARLCGRLPGGLGLAVVLVGVLMAASTGIVGATVVTMGLMSLPSFIKHKYDHALATGTICATATLGQIIPPSIALVLLGDVLSNAYQQAQLNLGIDNPEAVSVGDLFVGALVPGFLLALAYAFYVIVRALINPGSAPPVELATFVPVSAQTSFLASILPPVILIVLVLGSIVMGVATPTEAAGVGALGALLLGFFKRQISTATLTEVCRSTTNITCKIFLILIGASLFSLVLRGYQGDQLIEEFFSQLPGGVVGAMLVVMLVIFLLGFILDFIEITFVVVPIVGPILLAMGINPVWLGVMIAVNLQTSFLTPPFGFSLFYLRGVAPAEVQTADIYRGVIPFIVIQLLLLLVLAIWPQLIITL